VVALIVSFISFVTDLCARIRSVRREQKVERSRIITPTDGDIDALRAYRTRR